MIFSSRELVHVPWDSSSIELVHVLPNFLWALYIWRHEKPFSCGECNRLYTTRQVLRIHYSKHTREKPFECNLCGKQFKINQQLRVHKAAFTGERNFLCSGSQSKLIDNRELRHLNHFPQSVLTVLNSSTQDRSRENTWEHTLVKNHYYYYHWHYHWVLWSPCLHTFTLLRAHRMTLWAQRSLLIFTNQSNITYVSLI